MIPRRRGVILAALTLAALAGFVSCGGGGGGGGSTNPGTPAGSYNVTISVPVPGQSAVTTNVTLVVQ
jgi:ABC-type glycerol-3-phosphate transport system substrate-binding protein